MASDDQPRRAAHPRAGALARLPTGAKLLLILSAALLPLAVLSVFAALQTTRDDNLERRAELRVAATQSARTLAIELTGDMTALKETLDAIERDPSNAPYCARARGVLAQGLARGVRFGIFDRGGVLRCGGPVPGATLPRAGAAGDIAVDVQPGRGLLLVVPGSGGAAHAVAFFPTAFLADIGVPAGYDLPYGARLGTDRARLTLRSLDAPRLARRIEMRVPLGVGALALTLTVRSAPISSAVLIAMTLPILMWLAAAAIAWFVVDRLIVRPLRRLRTSVGAYTPGELFDPATIGDMPAEEIRQLSNTFRALSTTIRAHEADLADGLIRQTKLTREVHHRVKNNLQVIASLINFHARGAGSADVAAAYASIQRRVDALAVVHRNHYAELEVHRGLDLRSVIGELTANIRATASNGSREFAIILDVDRFLVTQDVAVAVSFLITEIVELAMTARSAAPIRISVNPAAGDAARAMLRLSSPALIETEVLNAQIATRYGRVIEGLSRQLRSKLHHDPLVGAFEIAIAVTGRD